MGSSQNAGLAARLRQYHWHGPSVHFHSALFPTAAVLLFIYLPTGEPSLEKASFYALGFGVLMLAGSIITGFFDWRTKYKSARTKVFGSKIRLSFILLSLGAALTLWRGLCPGLMEGGQVSQGLYTAGLVIFLPLTVRIGYLGGRLIFRRPK